MRKPIPNKLHKVASLLIKQDCKCYYCNCKLESQNNYKRYTLDHIEPYIKVGNKTEFVVACFRCNKLKGDLSEDQFKDGYICCNIKPGYDEQSYNKAIKVRNKIKWYEKMFPKLFWWNRKKYKLVIKEYD